MRGTATACFALTLLASGFRPVTAQQLSQLPSSGHVMRLTVGQVDVNVTVTDSHGHFVSGLHRGDFRVFDNGAERPIVSFASNEDPSHIVLVIESAAHDYLLAKVGDSPFADAAGFVNSIYSFDRVAIVTYSDRAYVVWDFAPSGTPVQLALKDLNSQLMNGGAGSSVVALSSSLAAVLYWLQGVQGKKAVVLISTGIDASPPQDRQFIKEELETSDVPLLAVSSFGDFRRFPPHQKLSVDMREERADVKEGMLGADGWLRSLATASSGHAYFPRDAKEFETDYAEVTQLIRGEYGLGFRPASHDGKKHSIAVKVSHPWYRSYHVDHRRAYMDSARAQK